MLPQSGLFIGNPVDNLAAFLNNKTPDGIRFTVVGGFDPQPLQGQATQQVITAHQSGAEIIFGGHSKGAMLAFYLAENASAGEQKIPWLTNPILIAVYHSPQIDL